MLKPTVAFAVFASVALAAPTGAYAHVRSGRIAVDYRASVFSNRALAKALSVRILPTDEAVRVVVRRGHSVTVIGYLGEPFIRVVAGKVLVNETSPTAAVAGLLRRSQRHGNRPRWVRWADRPTVVWHSASLRGLPPGVRRARWRIPLIVDGSRKTLTGELWRVPAPKLWSWLLLGAPFVAAVALILARRRDRVGPAAAVMGMAAGVAAIVAALAFMVARSADVGRVLEGANELVFALVGLAFLIRGSPTARAFAGGGLGLLAMAVGLSRAPVLLHGVVLSAFPAFPTRLAVAVAIWAGAAAATLGLVVFFQMLDEPDPALERLTVGGR